MPLLDSVWMQDVMRRITLNKPLPEPKNEDEARFIRRVRKQIRDAINAGAIIEFTPDFEMD